MEKFVSFLGETKKNQVSLKTIRDFKTWQPYPNVYKKLARQNLTIFFKMSERSLDGNFSLPTICESRKIRPKSGSFQDFYHFNRAAYYLTVWFGTKALLKIPFSSLFTVVWLNESRTI